MSTTMTTHYFSLLSAENKCPDQLNKKTSVSPDVRTAWYSWNMLKCKGVLYIQPRKSFLWGGSGVKSLSVVLWMKISTASFDLARFTQKFNTHQSCYSLSGTQVVHNGIFIAQLLFKWLWCSPFSLHSYLTVSFFYTYKWTNPAFHL